MICAVHDCPHWPKWILENDSDIQKTLGLFEQLGTKQCMLQFYDIRNRYWVSCSPTYPHAVKKDGYLLLRRSGTLCHDFEIHLENATRKSSHFRDNLPSERKFVKAAIQERMRYPPLDIISISDIEAEKARREKRKRLEDLSDHEDYPLSQRTRLSSPTTPVRLSPVTTLAERSPSIAVSSPISIPSPEVYVPSTCTRWPDGMFVEDMVAGFQLVNSKQMKKKYPRLSDRTYAVFKRCIPDSTYFDHQRYWKNASEAKRTEYINAGHTDAGLWSAFPKCK